MKIKNIMLITFLLLAVLTIGAVSASDDVALDNTTASDDTDDIKAIESDADDVIASEDDYDPEYHGFDIIENKIIIDEDHDDYDEEATVADITLPGDITEGSFQIFNGNESVGHSKISDIDGESSVWYTEDEYLMGEILLNDLDLTKIKLGDNLTFKFFEKNNGNLVLIDILTAKCTVSSLTSTYLKLTAIDEEYSYDDDDEIYVEYPEEYIDIDVVENEYIEFTIPEDMGGRIKIYVNKTLEFDKALSELDGEDDGDGSLLYDIYLSELNMNQPGKYIITSYFYDNDGLVKYNSTNDEDNEITITLYKSQIEDAGNVTITVKSEPITINGEDDSFIIVSSDANTDDSITISIEGQEPVTIKLNESERDEEDQYLIGLKQLNMKLAAGEYTLNITYKSNNITNKKIILRSNIVIEFEEDPVYFYFDDGFVFISLEDGEITGEDLPEGIINLTITDKDGNIIATYQQEIGVIQASTEEDEDNRIIFTTNLNKELDGTYTVTVRYFDGNEAETQASGEVTFKKLTAKDYGAKINSTIKNNNDTVITFTHIPTINADIIIKIDGDEIDDTAYLDQLNNQDEGNYYITYDKLNGLKNGNHSISVYIENNDFTNPKRVGIVNGTILVDIKGSIDPALTINATNIEEGNNATITITTNNTYTGKITVNVANKNHTVNITNGQGTLTIPDLKPDTYTATATFTYNEIFNDSIKTTTFKVTPKPIDPALTINATNIEEGNNATITITTNNTYTGKITVNVANKNHTVNITNGQGTLTIPDLKPDTYTATATFPATEIFTESTKTTTFKVTPKPIDPALTINATNIEEGNDAIVLITTNNTFTGEVQVKVANKTYKVNVTNGKGNVTISGLKADTYNATATFPATEIFTESTKTTTFKVTSKSVTPTNTTPANTTPTNTTPTNPTPSNDNKQVKKQVIKLTLKKVKIKKSAKKLVLTATLKINGKKVKGKTITFKFKGKTYKKKTNKKGVAKITIKKKVLKKLKVGKKVTYTAKYSTKKVKKTVKVKK